MEETRLLSDVAAAEVARLRRDARLSREELAGRCQRLGWEGMTTAVLTNIETGRRDSDGRRKREITVDELAVLAHALDVPPVLLLAPLGHEDAVEVLPGQQLDTLSAYEYLSGGKVAANTRTPADFDRMEDPPSDSAEYPVFAHTARPNQAVITYREHQAAMLKYMGADLEGDHEKKRRAWADVQVAQRTMQSFGWRIPPMSFDREVHDSAPATDTVTARVTAAEEAGDVL